MDGTLVDSEPVWRQATESIYGALDVPVDAERSNETKGLRPRDSVQHWYDQYHWPGPTVDEVYADLMQRVITGVKANPRMLPGVSDLLTHARHVSDVSAIASSSPMVLIDTVVDALGIASQIDEKYSAEFEEKGKPDPAVYLTAAKALHVDPGSCIVFEDSVFGMLAAKAAGMICIAVPEEDQRHRKEFAAADVIVDSLERVTEGMLRELFAR